MLVIKLAQTGKTNKKMFRLIISEKSRDTYGKVLEILGSYNPHLKKLQAKNERIKYWLSKGAQMTATINNLLIEKKVIDGQKVIASRPGKKKKKEENSKKGKPAVKTITDSKKKEAKEEPKEEVKEAKIVEK